MAKLGPGSMGIVAVLAMSGGAFYLAFRRGNGLNKCPLFHNSMLNFSVWQGVQIPVLCNVLPAQTSNLAIPQQKLAKATDQDEAELSSEALKSDGDGLNSKENEKDQFLLDSPTSTSSTASSLAEPSSETTKQKKKKKKVRFCESVVEPKGNNEEFRRNPKSKKVQGKGMGGMAMVAQNRAIKQDQKAILMRTGMLDRNRMVESLLGSKIQANRMALYSGMHRSMRVRRLLLLTD